MTYHIACRDLDPQRGCGFHTEGPSAEDIRDQFMSHGFREHADFRSAGIEELRRLEQSVLEILQAQILPPLERDRDVPNRTPVNKEASLKGMVPHA